jgi:hypothetical protein
MVNWSWRAKRLGERGLGCHPQPRVRQLGDLHDHRHRQQQHPRRLGDQPQARLVVMVGAVQRRDQRAGVKDRELAAHAAASPLAGSP